MLLIYNSHLPVTEKSKGGEELYSILCDNKNGSVTKIQAQMKYLDVTEIQSLEGYGVGDDGNRLGEYGVGVHGRHMTLVDAKGGICLPS